jgi:PKHD-type hydroxylase
MWFLNHRQDQVETWAYLPRALTKEQCEQVIKLGESLLPNTAETFGGVCPDVRDSKVSWIQPSSDSEWLFRHMTDIVLNLNNQFFKFDLDGFAEGLQFTKYEAPAGKYDVHIDKSYSKGIRKLSVVVQLSDPADYEGGELCIQTSNNPQPMQKEQGFLVAFPSYVLHGVQPVTKGTRYSLVAWLTGPAFK